MYRYDDVVLEDAVPPIIDKTLFDKVQATFRHNYTARAKAKAIEDYLLATKVFCGHCGEPMVGESGTSKTGKVHHYYKCVNRKRKHNCEKKVEKKEWLERTVVEFTVQQVLTDENIEKISTRAMELIEKELQDTSVLIGLQERLKETNKKIKNLMSAIEQGIITPTTKERLEELEEERRDLEGQIAQEEMKKPLLTKERIMYWLESFKMGDMEDVEYQRRIIDTLVNSVYVYDDGDKGRKLVLTFNISGNNTLTISSSDIERTAPLPASIPKSRFFCIKAKRIPDRQPLLTVGNPFFIICSARSAPKISLLSLGLLCCPHRENLTLERIHLAQLTGVADSNLLPLLHRGETLRSLALLKGKRIGLAVLGLNRKHKILDRLDGSGDCLRLGRLTVLLLCLALALPGELGALLLCLGDCLLHGALHLGQSLLRCRLCNGCLLCLLTSAGAERDCRRSDCNQKHCACHIFSHFHSPSAGLFLFLFPDTRLTETHYSARNANCNQLQNILKKLYRLDRIFHI